MKENFQHIFFFSCKQQKVQSGVTQVNVLEVHLQARLKPLSKEIIGGHFRICTSYRMQKCTPSVLRTDTR